MVTKHVGIPVGVHVWLEHEAKVLLMRRAATGFFDGLWSLPGGHLEEGESLGDCAVREAREELGVVLEPAALTRVGVVHRQSDSNRIDFFLRACRWQGQVQIAEPQKCDGLAWFAQDALPENTVDYIRAALAAGPGPWLLEFGWTRAAPS